MTTKCYMYVVLRVLLVVIVFDRCQWQWCDRIRGFESKLVFKICGVYFHRDPHALKSTLLIGIRLPYLPLPCLATVFSPGDLLGPCPRVKCRSPSYSHLLFYAYPAPTLGARTLHHIIPHPGAIYPLCRMKQPTQLSRQSALTYRFARSLYVPCCES